MFKLKNVLVKLAAPAKGFSWDNKKKKNLASSKQFSLGSFKKGTPEAKQLKTIEAEQKLWSTNKWKADNTNSSYIANTDISNTLRKIPNEYILQLVTGIKGYDNQLAAHNDIAAKTAKYRKDTGFKSPLPVNAFHPKDFSMVSIFKDKIPGRSLDTDGVYNSNVDLIQSKSPYTIYLELKKKNPKASMEDLIVATNKKFANIVAHEGNHKAERTDSLDVNSPLAHRRGPVKKDAFGKSFTELGNQLKKYLARAGASKQWQNYVSRPTELSVRGRLGKIQAEALGKELYRSFPGESDDKYIRNLKSFINGPSNRIPQDIRHLKPGKGWFETPEEEDRYWRGVLDLFRGADNSKIKKGVV